MLSTSDRKSEGDTTGFKYTLNTRLFCYPSAALVSFVMEFILTLKGSQALKISLFLIYTRYSEERSEESGAALNRISWNQTFFFLISFIKVLLYSLDMSNRAF